MEQHGMCDRVKDYIRLSEYINISLVVKVYHVESPTI